ERVTGRLKRTSRPSDVGFPGDGLLLYEVRHSAGTRPVSFQLRKSPPPPRPRPPRSPGLARSRSNSSRRRSRRRIPRLPASSFVGLGPHLLLQPPKRDRSGGWNLAGSTPFSAAIMESFQIGPEMDAP